jgi:hypothetical protein
VFPATDTIDALARPRARSCCRSACAIGYASGARSLSRLGQYDPRRLVLSPDWLATDDPEALLGGDRADGRLRAALENGMAIE